MWLQLGGRAGGGGGGGDDGDPPGWGRTGKQAKKEEDGLSD